MPIQNCPKNKRRFVKMLSPNVSPNPGVSAMRFNAEMPDLMRKKIKMDIVIETIFY